MLPDQGTAPTRFALGPSGSVLATLRDALHDPETPGLCSLQRELGALPFQTVQSVSMCALALQAAALAELRAQLTLPFVGGISTADLDKPKPQASGMPDNALDTQIDILMTADAHNPQGDKLTGSPKFRFASMGRSASCHQSSSFFGVCTHARFGVQSSFLHCGAYQLGFIARSPASDNGRCHCIPGEAQLKSVKIPGDPYP